MNHHLRSFIDFFASLGSLETSKLNSDLSVSGYAYILTHPGIPFIFVDHWMDETTREAIKKLISIRKDQNITSSAPVYIEKHEKGLYAAYIGGGNNWPCRWLSSTNYTMATVAMKLGSMDWIPSTESGVWIVKYDNANANVKIWVKDSTDSNSGQLNNLGSWLFNPFCWFVKC